MSRSNDDLTLQRFLDGALDATAANAFRARLAGEPELRRRLAQAQQVRAGFVAARDDAPRAPAGFAAGVLAAVRRLPDRVQLEQLERQQEQGDRIVRLCRRLLVAAAALFAVGLVWHSGLFDSRSDRLEAAPDEIRCEMERLDAKVRAGLGAGGSERPAERR
ncbi:MAG: hypothetical protein JNL08_07660 [Planctomycetes bacterium]|nr:hypothetical protein [Planctomycetota bacterium]